MSKTVVVFKDGEGRVVIARTGHVTCSSNIFHVPVLGPSTDPIYFGSILDRRCARKHFALKIPLTMEEFRWTAYIDEGIAHSELTQSLYDSIFMMADRVKT